MATSHLTLFGLGFYLAILSLMTSSLIRKYVVIIVILMLRQLRKWKVFIVSLFWITFDVRDNFRLLISNLNSKTQYQFEILKCK